MSKVDLCKQFVHGTYSEDDEYEIVETLVDIRAESCPCVFSLKTQCKKPATTPFGICNAHLKTKTGTNLALKWNGLLEALGIDESEEDEEEQGEGQGSQGQGEKTVTFDDPLVEVVEFDATEDVKPVEKDKAEEKAVKAEEKAKEKEEKKEATEKKAEEKAAEKEEKKAEKEAAEKEEKKAAEKKVEKEEEKKSESDSGVARYVPLNSEDQTSKEEEKPVKPKMRFAKSKFGNFVNDDTKLVIRQRDKVVLGTETDTGAIRALTDKEVEFCKNAKFNYISQE